MTTIAFIALIALFTLFPVLTVLAADVLTTKVRPWSTFATARPGATLGVV